MLKCKRAVIVLLVASGWWCDGAFAQSQHAYPSRGTPGTWHRGRFLGYVPAHLKHESRGSQAVSAPDQNAPQYTYPVTKSRSQVIPASFQEEVVDESLTTVGPSAASVAPSPAPVAENQTAQDVCCGTPWIWGRAEYLLWWTKGMDVPALATTGPETDPVPAALDQANTQILFGNTGLNDEARSGGRFTLGMWCDPCRINSVEVTYLGLGNETETFAASSDTFTVLGRPFFNTQTSAEDVEYIALPAALPGGQITGTLDITATTEFQSFEALFRHAAMRGCCTRVDYLIGYRFAELNDLLRIDENTVAPAPVGNQIVFDQFETRNTFHGAELGLMCQHRCNPCWSWEGVAKVALGGTRARADLTGETNGVAQGGLLVLQPTNMGTYSFDEFGVLTEVGIALRRELHCGITASVGYSFLHWNTVYRAGDQVDMTVNPDQIIPPGAGLGAARPAFPSRTASFWAQGLRFGLEYAF